MRYMAENFTAYEYKTLEEVLTVIKQLTSILSTTGMQLLETVSPSDLLSQLHSSSQLARAVRLFLCFEANCSDNWN
jgi:cohesin loading factor subunit SCC2